MAELKPAWKIRRFNPWLFSDIDSLLLNFFDEVTGALPVDQKTEARKKVGEYAKKLAPIGKFGGFFGPDLEDTFAKFGGFLSGDKSAEDRRSDLTAELDKLGFRVLIVMDDVDRLQPDELLTVLKLIRLIGDLPNIHYLLAYDERTLLDVLMGTPIGNENEGRAAQYVDKMVQVRFDLPPLTDHQQDTIFMDGIQRAFESANACVMDTEFRRLVEFFDERMRGALRVPRRINKYFGQLSAFLTPEIAREVDVIDFCILTFIRTFEGPLYYQLPGWKSELVGGGKDVLDAFVKGKEDASAHQGRWESRLAGAGFEGTAQSNALDLLGNLFPVIEQFTEPYRMSSHSAKERIDKRRISTAEYFDRYFQFAVPSNDISDALVAASLTYLVDGDESGLPASDEMRARLEVEPDVVLPKMWSLVRNKSCPSPRPLISLLNDIYGPLAAHPRNFAIRSPQDLVRQIGADVVSAIPESSRHDELEFFAETMDLAFLVQVAQLLHENGSPLPWTVDFRSVLTERAKGEIAARFPTLEDVGQENFEFFKSWGELEPEGVARSVARGWIEAGRWNIEDYLRLITGSSYLLGVKNPKPHLAELDEAWVDYFVGVEFAIEKLGHRLEEAIEPVSDKEMIDPSREVRLRHALRLLQGVKKRLTEKGGDD